MIGRGSLEEPGWILAKEVLMNVYDGWGQKSWSIQAFRVSYIAARIQLFADNTCSEGTSRSALDVLTGVATEYLFNVGRTLRYLCDKYPKQMSAEVNWFVSTIGTALLMFVVWQEIILHTLFESGITHIRDLERYITDDVMRYGNRLIELEKKLANAYNEVVL